MALSFYPVYVNYIAKSVVAADLRFVTKISVLSIKLTCELRTSSPVFIFFENEKEVGGGSGREDIFYRWWSKTFLKQQT